MKKKVLILSGSPRKHGNSDLLCDEFMKGALEAGHEVEKIRMQKKKPLKLRFSASVAMQTVSMVPKKWEKAFNNYSGKASVRFP